MADPQDGKPDENSAWAKWLAQREEAGAPYAGPSFDVNSPSVLAYVDGKEKLSVDEAKDVLNERLRVLMAKTGFGTERSVTPEMRLLADSIVLSLPERALTADLLNNIDVRPYSTALSTWAGELQANGVDAVEYWKRKQPIGQLVERTQQMTEQSQSVINEWVKTNSTTDAELERTFPIDPAVATLDPSLSLEVQQAQVAAGEAPGATNWLTGSDRIEAPTVPADDIRRLLAMGDNQGVTAALDIISGVEGDSQNPQNVTGDDVSLAGIGSSPDPGYTEGRGDRMSLMTAAQYLTSTNVTPKQIRALQDKLVAAGYGDGMGVRPTPGDGYDRVTNAMWQQAVGEAFMRNVPIDQLLAEKAKTRLQGFGTVGTVEERMLQQVASSTLGRQLNDTEMLGLTRQLYAMKQEQIPAGGGADGTSESGGGVMSEGMWFGVPQVERALIDSGMENDNTMTNAAGAAYSMNNMIDAWMNDAGM